MGAEPGDGMLAMLLRLVDELRADDVEIALVEVLDAVDALRHLDLADRSLLRAALRATLVKHLEDDAVYDVLFDRCFPVTRPATPPVGSPGTPEDPPRRSSVAGDQTEAAPDLAPAGREGEADVAKADLLDALLRALRDRDDAALAVLAAQAVEAHAGVGEAGGSPRYHLYRVMRALDLAGLLANAMRQERGDAGSDASELALRLRRDELAVRLDDLRRLLADEILHRLHGSAVTDLPALRRLDHLDLADASRSELRALRQAVRPLARKLAAKVAQRRRRHRAGRLDMRRTLRRSLAFGGAPMEPVHRRRRTSKPDVVVLCDLSGSVAEFAGFTLALVHALHAELARLRTFVFVDGVAEVTEVLDRADGVPDAFHLLGRAGVISGDGHSDYGRAFARFWLDHGHVIGSSTTLIVTGDARTNHRPAGLGAFGEVCARAKRVYWLNPEPRSDWGTTDSMIGDYAPSCTKVFEVRSLHQLGDAVAEIM